MEPASRRPSDSTDIDMVAGFSKNLRSPALQPSPYLRSHSVQQYTSNYTVRFSNASYNLAFLCYTGHQTFPTRSVTLILPLPVSSYAFDCVSLWMPVQARPTNSSWFNHPNSISWYRIRTPLQKTFFYDAAAQRGPWPPHSWCFQTTHNDAPQSVRLLWTSDQPVAETSTWQHTTLTANIHAPRGIRTHNLSRRAAADLGLRLRGHWHRPTKNILNE